MVRSASLRGKAFSDMVDVCAVFDAVLDVGGGALCQEDIFFIN